MVASFFWLGDCCGMEGGSPAPTPAPAAEPAAVTEWASYAEQVAPVDEGRGDWFKKRKILQQARRSYQDIRKQVQEIQEVVQHLTHTYEPSIRERTQALQALGITQEEINKAEVDLNQSIVDLVNKQSRLEVDRQALIDLNDSKKLLDMFKEDMVYLFELQRGMVQGVSLLKAQVERCVAYEKNAWKLYELIDAALNDNIAQQMFDELQTTVENIGLIRVYIENDLKKYIQTTLQAFDAQHKAIQDAYGVLVKRGVFVDKNAPQDTIKTDTATKAAVKPAQGAGTAWWHWLVLPFEWLWNLIARIWR